MGAIDIFGKLAGKWHEASERADEMGIPHIDHFMGLSIPGLTNPVNEDEPCGGTEGTLRIDDDARIAR